MSSDDTSGDRADRENDGDRNGTAPTVPSPEHQWLLAVFSENWKHARHQELQRSGFATIVMTLYLAVFAYFKADLSLPVRIAVGAFAIIGIMLTLKTSHVFDKYKEANQNIVNLLGINEFTVLPASFKEEKKAIRIVRIRWLFIGLYLLLIALCFVPA